MTGPLGGESSGGRATVTLTVTNLTSSVWNQRNEQPATTNGSFDSVDGNFAFMGSATTGRISPDFLDVSAASVLPWAGLLASVLLMILCLVTNVTLVLYVKRCVRQMPRLQNHKRDCNVANLLCLIAGVSACNGCLTCLVHIASFLLGNLILSNTFCKILGLAASFMSLLIIWYKALLGFERYLKFVKPQEHFVTFSKVNVQIMVMGISFVLMSAVSGPIYGWGDYAYMKELHSCNFDLSAPNAVSYFALSSLSYVAAPYTILGYSCFAILLNVPSSSEPLPVRSASILERKAVVVAPLASHVVVAILLEIPVYVLGVYKAVRPTRHLDPRLHFAASWLQTFAVNVCLACAILTHRALNAGCRRQNHVIVETVKPRSTCLTSTSSLSNGSSTAAVPSSLNVSTSAGCCDDDDAFESVTATTTKSGLADGLCPCLKGALKRREETQTPMLMSRLNSTT